MGPGGQQLPRYHSARSNGTVTQPSVLCNDETRASTASCIPLYRVLVYTHEHHRTPPHTTALGTEKSKERAASAQCTGDRTSAGGLAVTLLFVFLAPDLPRKGWGRAVAALMSAGSINEKCRVFLFPWWFEQGGGGCRDYKQLGNGIKISIQSVGLVTAQHVTDSGTARVCAMPTGEEKRDTGIESERAQHDARRRESAPKHTKRAMERDPANGVQDRPMSVPFLMCGPPLC